VSLISETKKLTRSFVAKGGKQNRRKQAKRMLAFVEFSIKNSRANDFEQIGKNHVKAYFKANEGLSNAVLYQHWLALCELWTLLGRASKPPRPKRKIDLKDE
jgi:hypothetical protein